MCLIIVHKTLLTLILLSSPIQQPEKFPHLFSILRSIIFCISFSSLHSSGFTDKIVPGLLQRDDLCEIFVRKNTENLRVLSAGDHLFPPTRLLSNSPIKETAQWGEVAEKKRRQKQAQSLELLSLLSTIFSVSGRSDGDAMEAALVCHTAVRTAPGQSFLKITPSIF